MTAIVFKAPDTPAVLSHLPEEGDPLEALQSIIEGHISLLVLASDGKYRMTMVMRDGENVDSAEPINVRIGEQEIRGPVAIVRYTKNATPEAMTAAEVNAWIEFLDEAAKAPDPEPDTRNVPPPVAAAGVSIVLAPVSEDEPPEAAVDAVMADVGVGYSHIHPKTEHGPALYAAALETLRMQGHQFDILDQADFKLRIEGRDGVQDKYVRLIKLEDEDPIATAQDLASIYNVDPIEDDWQKTLCKTVATAHNVWLSLSEEGVEVGVFEGEHKEIGFPMAYPFTPDEWADLVASASPSAG